MAMSMDMSSILGLSVFHEYECKAGSRWSILLTRNVAFVNVIDHVGNCDEEY